MSIYRNLNPILIGSHKYGVFTEDSDWDYMIIVPESQLTSFLNEWKDAEISEFPNPKRYRVRGVPPTENHIIEGSPDNAMYDLTVVSKPDGMSDNRFIKENWRIYWMIHISDIPDGLEAELKERLMYIKKWAKDNNVYGGTYPGGIGYFLYALNTLLKGYTREKAYSQIYQRCLYYHPEYKYTHISYMADSSFNHMKNIIKGEVAPYQYQYQIDTDKQEEMLHAAKYLLNSTNDSYIDNNCIIHSTDDIGLQVQKWVDDLQKYNITAQIRKK